MNNVLGNICGSYTVICNDEDEDGSAECDSNKTFNTITTCIKIQPLNNIKGYRIAKQLRSIVRSIRWITFCIIVILLLVVILFAIFAHHNLKLVLKADKGKTIFYCTIISFVTAMLFGLTYYFASGMGSREKRYKEFREELSELSGDKQKELANKYYRNRIIAMIISFFFFVGSVTVLVYILVNILVYLQKSDYAITQDAITKHHQQYCKKQLAKQV